MFISLFLFFLSYFGKIDDIEIELGNGKITCPKKKVLVFIFISFHFIADICNCNWNLCNEKKIR